MSNSKLVEETLPAIATPEMWPVRKTCEDAVKSFPDLAISIGVGENGPIRFQPLYAPHRLVVGVTGSGRSVALRAELMQYLAGLYRVFAVDGKGTDYIPFVRFPNVSAVSTNLHEHVLVIHTVWQLLQQRRRRATEMSKRGDMSWRSAMTPILLVLDEWAYVRSCMKAEFDPSEVRLIERDLVDILKIGREFRVNILLATQDLKADTVPSDWLDMFKVVQSMGKPSPMVVNKAFPEQVQHDVSRIGGTISAKTPGRGVVAATDEDGRFSAEPYQAYWSYSPAEVISGATPAAVRANWEQFKNEVVDQIPRLYPRVWAEVEYPQPVRHGEDRYAKFRGDHGADLSNMGVADIHRLAPVDLEDPKTLEPITDNEKYDPLSASYQGREPHGDPVASVTDFWA